MQYAVLRGWIRWLRADARFDRNLNTDDPDIAQASKKVTATNTILHEAAHPSSLVISVLASALPATRR